MKNKIKVNARTKPKDLDETLHTAEVSLGIRWKFDYRIQYDQHEIIIKIRHLPMRIEGDDLSLQHTFCSNVEVSQNEYFLDGTTICKAAPSLKIRTTPQAITLKTDRCGIGRLYFLSFENTTLVTDDAKYSLYLAKILELPIQRDQIFFWLHSRTTHAPATIFDNLYKVPAGFCIEASSKGTFLLQNRSEPSSTEDFKTKNSLLEVMARAFERGAYKEPVILMFSGGSDSILIARALRKANIKFNLVYFHPCTIDADDKALRIALAGASRLGVPLDIRLVDMPSAYEILQNNIDSFLLDRHASLLHIGGFAAMQDVPIKTPIFNGQSSDSIFSFGPSSYSIQDFLRRLLMTPIVRWAAFPIFPVIKKIFRVGGLSWPKTHLECVLASSFFERYLFAYPKDYCASRVVREVMELKIASGLTLPDFIFSGKENFIQGSDGQVVRQAAEISGFQNIVMPFCDSEVIQFAHQNRRSFLEIFYPKGVVRSHVRDKNDVTNSGEIQSNERLERVMAVCAESGISLAEYMNKTRDLYIQRMRSITGLQDIGWERQYPLPL